MRAWLLIAVLAAALPGADVWTVRVEEPTGLYRRTDEVVRVPLARVGGHLAGFQVTAPDGRDLPWQVSAGELLFPASLIPGELPAYRVACCTAGPTPLFANPIRLRRIGMRRVELGNQRFRLVIDTGVPAIVEAYSLTAGPQRMLNFVETTPEDPKALVGDVHESSPEARQALPRPVPGIEGGNTGWTSTGASGPMSSVGLLEAGPLRGRLRLSGAGETWEFVWTSNSAALLWKARGGFRFTAVSAAPYVPFDRFLDGSEYVWPTGPGEPEPADHDIAPRAWTKLPGGHAVYYQFAENYGALGIVALDADLAWKGIGSRRFVGSKRAGETEIALTFPDWRGGETVLQARQENRLVRQPLLVDVSGPVAGELRASRLPLAAQSATLTALSPAAGQSVATAAPAAALPPVGPQTGGPPVRTGRPTSFTLDALPLDGPWELAFTEKGAGLPVSGWRTVEVPGDVHLQWLEEAKVFTREAEWISGKEWWYRRHFILPARFAGKRLRLQFDATDYYADTYVNGHRIGRHEGYIDPYEYEVTSALRSGESNEIAVRVWTPVTYYWKHRAYTIKGAYGAVDQKPDDITALGITRSVRLVASRDAFVRDVAVDTRLTESGAEIAVDVESDGAAHTWELTLAPRNFTSAERYQVRAAAGPDQRRIVMAVPHPRLWWTWDHGRPDLYTLEIRLLDDQGRALDGRSLAVGIREIEKIGWDFYLNRKRLFIRGTNYYYHLFLAGMDRAKYARDLRLMLGMNVNLIRVHCHFSNPEFYDLADEQGVLLWQDFLEAWYPHDRRFAQRAAALYDHHIRYVRNHPSVALWATSDEEDFENYREITKHLAPRPSALDPQQRPVVRSTGRFGDSHVYYGWYEGSIWQYAGLTQAFVSELGATALPNYQTLIQFMPDQWPFLGHEAEWQWRRLQLTEALRAWGDPGGMSLAEYIPKTQAYVARLFQIALERMRRRKAEGAGGVIHFHAIDIWPSVTMAAIDFNRIPARVYDTVRRSFAPVAANFEYDRDRWKPGERFRCGLWAINDRWEAIDGARLRWRIVNTAGEASAAGEWSAPLPGDSALKIGDVNWTARAAGAYQLRAAVIDAGGREIAENIFEFEVGK